LNDVVTRMMGGLHMGVLYEKTRGNANHVGVDPTTGQTMVYKGRQERLLECGICMNELTMEETYSFDCPDSHRVCIQCAVNHCREALGDSRVPSCIDGQCPHMVSTNELKQLEQLILAHDVSGQQVDLSTLPRGSGRVMKKLSEVREELVLAGFLTNRDDVVACPTPDCPGYQFMNDPSRCEQLNCDLCHETYGSKCRLLYHYHVGSCQEVPSLVRRYTYWKTEQRLPFLQHLAQQRAESAVQLTEYNKRQAQLEQDQKIAEAMNNAEEADEKYKADHCIHCPKCQRIMERLSGCDSMVCGRNFHGGDQQDGCGHNFNIKKAKKYVAKSRRERTIDANTVEKPQAETKHEIMKGYDLKCDACSQPIVGPRFECIHCPAFNCCSGCEANIGTAVNHPLNHVFKLHMRESNGGNGGGNGGQRK
jgi:hypothetical protein